MLAMSPQIKQESDSPSARKRSHDEYSDIPTKGPQLDLKVEVSVTPNSSLQLPLPILSSQSPAQSSPTALTEAGSSTPGRNSAPNTPTRQPLLTLPSNLPTATATMPANKTFVQPAGQPPAKKAKTTTATTKLTPAEKQRKEDEKAAKKKEQEESRAAKEQVKKAKAEEAERKRQEVERKKKEKEEEMEKKAKLQPKIATFFMRPKPPPTVKTEGDQKDAATTKQQQGSPPTNALPTTKSEYELRFKPFFVKEHVTLATTNFFMDGETQQKKSVILDEYLQGIRPPPEVHKPFDVIKALDLPAPDFFPRGISHPNIQKLILEFHDNSSAPVENSQIKHTRDLLKKVPLKYLSFYEDVRPAYYGTITKMSVNGLQKLARKPLARDLAPLDYDYDSEAEWEDDCEEGAGTDIDAMDDDEEDDDDEGVDDFLDDTEDAGLARSAAFTGAMEPQETGLCFENRNRMGPKPQMLKFCMEFIIPNLQHHHSIDPFSTEYWEQPKKTSPMPTKSSKAVMPPPAAPTIAAALSSTPAPVKKLVPADQMEAFKGFVLEFKTVTKIGLVDILSSKFPDFTKAQVKNTLELVAEKPGKSQNWRIKNSP